MTRLGAQASGSPGLANADSRAKNHALRAAGQRCATERKTSSRPIITTWKTARRAYRRHAGLPKLNRSRVDGMAQGLKTLPLDDPVGAIALSNGPMA